jgi:uncharacterized cofD-like protein
MKTKKKKIVVIGGGNGSAISICALKQFTDIFDISAVVSMSDSGGSSGRLREEFKTLPPGDILRAVLAMSKYDYKILKQIFYRNRFTGVGKLDNHNLGNLFIILSEKYGGDFMQAIRALEQAVEAIGHVFPVTLNKTDLIAELSNSKIVRQEAKIDRPNYDKNLKIKKVWLEPSGKIDSNASKAIVTADAIVLGPGSLYCSIVATLLPLGVCKAIANSKAKLVYIAGDAYELRGETGPQKLSGFVLQLQEYLPRKLDAIIYNNVLLNKTQKDLYKMKKWGVIEKDVKALIGYNVIGADFEKANGGLDPVKLGNILKNIICK